MCVLLRMVHLSVVTHTPHVEASQPVSCWSGINPRRVFGSSPQYSDYVRYVEPCFKGMLVQADLDNREVTAPAPGGERKRFNVHAPFLLFPPLRFPSASFMILLRATAPFSSLLLLTFHISTSHPFFQMLCIRSFFAHWFLHICSSGVFFFSTPTPAQSV